MSQINVAQATFSSIWVADSENVNEVLAEPSSVWMCVYVWNEILHSVIFTSYFCSLLFTYTHFLFKIKWKKYPDVNDNGT